MSTVTTILIFSAAALVIPFCRVINGAVSCPGQQCPGHLLVSRSRPCAIWISALPSATLLITVLSWSLTTLRQTRYRSEHKDRCCSGCSAAVYRPDPLYQFRGSHHRRSSAAVHPGGSFYPAGCAACSCFMALYLAQKRYSVGWHHPAGGAVRFIKTPLYLDDQPGMRSSWAGSAPGCRY